MQLTAHLRRAAARPRDERGFTMVTVVISMMVVVLVSVAALSAAQGDLTPGKHDTDRKVAYAAAEAGLQNYLFHLTDDSNYWSKCTSVSAAVNDPWDGTSTRKWASLPGSRARYTIELLPANGNAKCLTSSPDSTMIDSGTGTFRIRVTGQALKIDGTTGVKRTLVANFKRQSLLDFIYFTDKENLDPTLASIRTGGLQTANSAGLDVVAWGTQDPTLPGASGCARYYGNNTSIGNRASQTFSGNGNSNTGIKVGSTWYAYSVGCTEIQFASGDVVRGPLHTNDEVLCQNTNPVIKFGRTPADNIEVASTGETAAAPTGYRTCTPYVNFGGSTAKADAGSWKGKGDGTVKLDPPPSNSSLKRDTDAPYRFVGKTTVVLNGNGSMNVTGTREDGSVATNEVDTPPADGVFYVANSPTLGCTTYNPIATSTASTGCGNLNIEGTYSANMTFTAENDIVVTGNLKRASGNESLLGLISNNFIRVSHPVTSQTFTPNITSSGSGPGTVSSVTAGCTNSASSPTNIQIDAAILSLNHSFIVDNYYCGASLGNLTINGAIAQLYRGAVGTSGGTGYIKNYTYDDRLKYRSPPKFLDPVKAGWVIKTFNEQVPAR
jgi:Tfp pilus assembly protein PilV